MSDSGLIGLLLIVIITHGIGLCMYITQLLEYAI